MGMEGRWWKQEVTGDRMCPCIKSGFEYHNGMDGYYEDETGYESRMEGQDGKDDMYYGPGADNSKYFYEAKCEYEYIDGCAKANPSSSAQCPDFESCFQSRMPGLLLESPLSNENASKSGAVRYNPIFNNFSNFICLENQV